MNKKNYQKPTMEIVKLEHQSHILAGSVDASRSSYGDANSQTWVEDEEE